jgi:hypothetical protein
MSFIRIGMSTGFAGSRTRAMALIAAVALVVLSLGAGVTLANNGRPHVQAENTFTKWLTGAPFQPGDVLDMAGVVGGDVGSGAFAGTVLSVTDFAVDPLVLNAIYGFNGSAHSFKALTHIVQTGTHAVLIGVVIDGWMAGHQVQGEYTVGTCTHGDVTGTCFSGTLDIMQAFKP